MVKALIRLAIILAVSAVPVIGLAVHNQDHVEERQERRENPVTAVPAYVDCDNPYLDSAYCR